MFLGVKKPIFIRFIIYTLASPSSVTAGLSTSIVPVDLVSFLIISSTDLKDPGSTKQTKVVFSASVSS